MKRMLSIVAALVLASALMLATPAGATVVAHIDLSSQRMSVSVDGSQRYNWAVSTARRGYSTPTGSYRPQRMYRRYYSKKYYNSPMPYSIFFRGGYAIHGTNYMNQLGRPASHGCVRLAPGNAAALYSLVQQYGKGDTRIVITR